MQDGTLSIYGSKKGRITLEHNRVLKDSIEREIAETDYIYKGEDKALLLSLMDRINSERGTNIQHLAELDSFHIRGAGEIIAQYINRFSSEAVKAYLIPQLVLDKVKDCDKIILQSYLQFQESNEYISLPGKPAPAHIYVRYDNAFRKMKSKRIVDDLLRIITYPRNAFYLPLTVNMLASWKTLALKNVLLMYATPNNISMQDVGISKDGQSYFPPFSYICRELRFTAINGLRYYPSDETLNTIRACMCDLDPDIRCAARKVMNKISKAEDGSRPLKKS